MALRKTIRPPKIVKSNSLATVKIADQPIKVKYAEEDYDKRPSVSFTEAELPEMKNWTIKKKYMVEMEVEMTSTSVIDYGDDKGKVRAEFKINKVGVDTANDKGE